MSKNNSTKARAVSRSSFLMTLRTFGVLIFFIFSFFYAAPGVQACSSFMLKKGGKIIYGHNLDSRRHKPGVVVVNKRGVKKQSKSWTELAYGKSVPNPHITWVSKYGSITFNKYRSFPDGGMNEAGLFIAEMSLVGTQFPKDDSKPLFFMMLWMQYALDNYDSVDQVVKSAHDLSIEGWSWHFFTADRKGNVAMIEFLEGKVVVHQGDRVPVPVLCNTAYSEELEGLKAYKGFGGDKPIDLSSKKQSGVVQVGRMIKDFDPNKHPVMDYGFKILSTLGWSGSQWSYVYDPVNLKVHFKTKDSPGIKTLDFKAFDFSCKTPVKMLDIHFGRSGAVEKDFRDYSLQYNRECARKNFVAGNYEPVFTSHGSTLEAAVQRFAQYPESTKCQSK